MDTGSAFSMLSSSLYDRLPDRPPVQSLRNSAPNIVGVGGASAEVKGYINVPLQIAGIKVAHPLLVVANNSFPILIGTDILRPHAASMSLGESMPFCLNTRVCDNCLERRTDVKRSFFKQNYSCVNRRPDHYSTSYSRTCSSSCPPIDARVNDSSRRFPRSCNP